MIITNSMSTKVPQESGTLGEINKQEFQEDDTKQVFNEDLANIIRRCWQTNPAQRPSFAQIYKMLIEQQTMIKNEEIGDMALETITGESGDKEK